MMNNKPEVNFSAFDVLYQVNGARVNAVRLSCESRTGFYAVSLTADGRKYFTVNGSMVQDLPKTPYTVALMDAYRQCVFLLSRYLNESGAGKNAVFWEIKDALKA